MQTFTNLKLNTVTFELIMQCTSLNTFWKGIESNNPYLTYNFTKFIYFEKIAKNYFLGPKFLGRPNKNSFWFKFAKKLSKYTNLGTTFLFWLKLVKDIC